MEQIGREWSEVALVAAAAWAGAAAFGCLLLPSALRAIRIWAVGFVLLGFALFAAEYWHQAAHFPYLIGRLGTIGAVALIGTGLLRCASTLVPQRAAVALTVGLILPAVLLTAVPELQIWIFYAADAVLVGLSLALAIYCIFKRQGESGGKSERRLRFMGVAFLLIAGEPFVGYAVNMGLVQHWAHMAYSIGYTVLLTLGLAVIALRSLQVEAEASEERLRWTEERFDLALRGASDGVWDWDLESNTILLTPRLLEICRIDTDKQVHTPSELERYIHPDDAADYRSSIADVLKGRSDTFQTEFRLKPRTSDPTDNQPTDNRPMGDHWCLNRGLAVRGSDGWVLRMAGTITDITERKRFERQLIDAKEEAELARRSMSEFLAHMSHELRTPLNAIIGFTDVMKQQIFGPIENPRYLEYADTVNMAGRHLLRIINDIIDLSKIESGQTKLEDMLFDPRELLEGCLDLVGPRAAEGGLTLRRNLPSPMPWLRGDATRVKQVVLNLLTNAVKFTPAPGTVTLTAKETPDGSLVLRVDDTGVGIARKDIPTALSRFGRLGSPYVRNRDGMGLGLTLVQIFAKLHGARFDLDSKEGEGTTATVTFPPWRVAAREGAGAPGREANREARAAK